MAVTVATRLRRLLAAALLSAATAATASAQQHPSHERGFDADKAYAFGDVDSVNLLNGNVTLTFPIGQGFPVSESFSYGLNLIYNSKAWDFQEAYYQGNPHSQALPDRLSNAGMGWSVSLGRIIGPDSPFNDYEVFEWVYFGADGADHRFYKDLHDPGAVGTDYCQTQGVCYTRDGSYLRLRSFGTTVKELDFPDGTIHTFTRFVVGPQWEWRLTGMRDRLEEGAPGSQDVAITYSADGNTWTLTDRHNRVQKVIFEVAAGDRYPRRVKQVKLSSLHGTADYNFGYLPLNPIATPCSSTLPSWQSVKASQLSSVLLPDGTMLGFTYYAGNESGSCHAKGLIHNVVLPAGGVIDYAYRTHTLPITGCSYRAWHRNSAAIASRKLRDRNGAIEGEWKYTAILSNPPAHPVTWCNEIGTAYQPPPEQLTVTVESPQHDKQSHYFSVWPGDDDGLTSTSFQITDYGLPFTRMANDGSGRFKSVESKDCAADGTNCVSPRTSYVRFERDALGGCGWELTPSCMDVNRRLAAQSMLYEDGKQSTSERTEFDGFGHYRKTTLGGNFGSADARVVETMYNANSTKWLLGLFDAEIATELGKVAKREICFDRDTGFLLRQRMLKSETGARHGDDVLVVYTPDAAGNRTREEYHGGDGAQLNTGADVCAVAPGANRYRLDHTYTAGVRATSRYADAAGTPLSFYTLKQTINPATGLVVGSETAAGDGTAGVTTSYDYDSLGRLTWVMPQAGHGAWVGYAYVVDGDTGRRAVKIEQRDNGSQTGTLLTQQTVVVDDLGRTWLERRLMPDGTTSQQETRYTEMGWKASVSEAAASTDSGAAKTLFQNYDPYGRPRTIVQPDGSVVTLVYTGISEASRTVRVGTTYDSGSGQVLKADAETREVFDRQGRLWKLLDHSGPANALVSTAYAYDVGGRLKRVCQGANPSATSCGQERLFVYDNRGFLTDERHPEKGTNGTGMDGWVKYASYDPRGHAGERKDGTAADHELLFDYDRAERLLRVREKGTGFSNCDAGSGPRCLKELVYGPSNLAGNWRNGKVWKAIRYNYATLGAFAYTAKVEEIYTYGERQGAASRRDTNMFLNGGLSNAFTQTFAYDALGEVTSLGYPYCASCGAPARTVNSTYSRGLLTAVPGFATSITYHPNAMAFRVAHGNGITDTQAISADSIRRPQQLFAKHDGFLRWDTGNYEYDGAANVVKMGPSWYTYDLVSRVTEGSVVEGATGGGVRHNQKYDLDPFGNVTKITTDGVARNTPTSAATNRLNSAVAYDAGGAGNLVTWQIIGSGASAQYQYDGLNMMSRMTAGAEDWVYIYTADDQRLLSYRADVVPTSVWTLRDLDGKVLREYVYDGATWRLRRDYVYGGARLLASEGQGQSFSDVPPTHWAAAEVEAMKASGVTAGCAQPPAAPAYCPSLNVSRDQMSVFLVVATSPPGYEPPACVTPMFNDVPCSNNLAKWINELARRGITAGCGNGNFCPSAPVTKGQMSVFILAAQGVSPPPCTTPSFNDYTCAQPPYYYAAYAEEVFRRGIDLGCGNGNFCPEQIITRDKMAVWMTRGFNLPIPDMGFTRHYHLDHLGTPRLVTSTAGTPLAHHAYFPFGIEATSPTQDAERMKFAGNERDLNGQTGSNPTGDDLDYLHARHYHPGVARFVSPDPAPGDPKAPQGWNRYAYVQGRALTFVDPTGRVLEFSGSPEMMRLMEEILNSGLLGEEVKIDAAGRATLVKNDQKGTPTPQQATMASFLRGVISDPKTTSIKLVSGDTDALIGHFTKRKLDVGDVNAFGGGPGSSRATIAIHEIVEQWAGQVGPGQGDQKASHSFGWNAEQMAGGYTRTDEAPQFYDGGTSARLVSHYVSNGVKVTVVVVSTNGNVVSVSRP